MDLIEEYKLWDPEAESVIQDLCKNKLNLKLYQILKESGENLLSNVFQFSLEYGLLPIIKFLYQAKKVKYNFKWIEQYMDTPKPQSLDTAIKIPIATGKSDKTRIKVQLMDKYSIRRIDCINYLLNMRKYSKYTYGDGNFYYQYNR